MIRVTTRVLLTLTTLPLVAAFPGAASTVAADSAAPSSVAPQSAVPESAVPESAVPESAVPESPAPVSVVAEAWGWPVSEPHPIVRPYIAPETPYSAGHRGIDIDAGRSAQVYAPTAGIVNFAGTVVDRPVLSIRHPGGLISSYEPVTSTLARGDIVAREQVVGEVQTGHCVRACLHFGVRLDGNYVSPLNYLSGTPRAVLLPTRQH